MIAAAAFAADQRRAGALCLALAGALDILDGALARVSGQVSPFGAFLDSVLDRYSDLLVLAGIVFLFARLGRLEAVAAVLLALIGTVMVSYTRARAESVDVECRVGLMERGERMLVLIARRAAGPPGPGDLGGRPRGERDGGPPDRPHLAGHPRRPALIGTARRSLLVHWAAMSGGRSALAAVVVAGLLVVARGPPGRGGGRGVAEPAPALSRGPRRAGRAGSTRGRARSSTSCPRDSCSRTTRPSSPRRPRFAEATRRSRSRASGRSSSASRTPLLVPQAQLATLDTVFRLGSWAEAEREARRFLARAPAHPEAGRVLVRLAEARAAQGQVAEALADLRRRWIEAPASAWGEAARESLEDLARGAGLAVPPLTVEEQLPPGAAAGGRGRAERLGPTARGAPGPGARSRPCATARSPGSRRCSVAWPGATRPSPGSTPP